MKPERRGDRAPASPRRSLQTKLQQPQPQRTGATRVPHPARGEARARPGHRTGLGAPASSRGRSLPDLPRPRPAVPAAPRQAVPQRPALLQAPLALLLEGELAVHRPRHREAAAVVGELRRLRPAARRCHGLPTEPRRRGGDAALARELGAAAGAASVPPAGRQPRTSASPAPRTRQSPPSGSEPHLGDPLASLGCQGAVRVLKSPPDWTGASATGKGTGAPRTGLGTQLHAHSGLQQCSPPRGQVQRISRPTPLASFRLAPSGVCPALPAGARQSHP